MRKKYFAFGVMLLVYQTIFHAQTFETQILNKEQFKSAASLTQDYDGDGDLDIILTRWSPAGIYWLENDSTKQFPATPIITENLSFYIADIDLADFDNDGDMDYVVCFTGVNDGELAWFQRLEDGTYQKWTIATNKDFIEADVADFNGDGLVDIATIGLINSDKNCRVYTNQGNLFFNEKIIAQGVHGALDVDDIDGDGDFDIAVTGIGFVRQQSEESEGSRTLLNDGEGNFTLGKWLNAIIFVSTTSMHETIKIVDFNGDGVKDFLSFKSNFTGGLYFFDGTRTGDFNDIEGIEIDDDNGAIDLGGHLVVFDIDNDGLLDIVRQGHGEDRISVLYQLPNFRFRREYIDLNWDNCCNPSAKMSFGDLDNDGDIDLVFPEQGNVDEDVSWYENIDGRLYKHQIHGVLEGVRVPKMVDWDNDGDLDIFATVSSGQTGNRENELILYENIDGKNFINWRLNDALDYAADVEFADIDGDGDLDAFATARDADDLVWLRNDGFQANWVTDTIFPEGNAPLGIATDDIDGDGDADVVMCSFNDDKVLGFKNDGNANFSPFVVDANINGPREAKISDLDNDGDKDIIIISPEVENTVTIYINDGAENFVKEIIYTGFNARDLDIGDWNQDGRPDIFVGFFDRNIEVIGLINSVSGFIPDTFHIENDRVTSIKLADLDGDNDLDILTGHGEGTPNFKPVLIASIIEDGEIVHSIPLTNNQEGSITGIDIGDINGDGILDIVYADFNRENLVLITNECLVNPVVDLGEDITIDSGESIVLDATGDNLSYLWSTGATTPTILVNEAGIYSITITNILGCTGRDSVLVSIVTEVKNLTFNSLIKVFPNPTKQHISILNDSQTIEIQEINLFDPSGNVIIHKSPNVNNLIEVNLEQLPSGLYFLWIKTDEGYLSKKLIKE